MEVKQGGKEVKETHLTYEQASKKKRNDFIRRIVIGIFILTVVVIAIINE